MALSPVYEKAVSRESLTQTRPDLSQVGSRSDLSQVGSHSGLGLVPAVFRPES